MLLLALLLPLRLLLMRSTSSVRSLMILVICNRCINETKTPISMHQVLKC